MESALNVVAGKPCSKDRLYLGLAECVHYRIRFPSEYRPWIAKWVLSLIVGSILPL